MELREPHLSPSVPALSPLAPRYASRVQSFIRQNQFTKRVANRVRSKKEKAARVVQHHYRNRLHLGAGGSAFAAAVQASIFARREEEARQRAQRRAETEKRLEAEMGQAKRRAQKNARGKALAQALKERAAVDLLQKSVRRCLGTMVKRRLRVKRAMFLRHFTGDQTGHALRMLTTFQKRVKLWIANNSMFLSLYEEHRRSLAENLSRPNFLLVGADVDARLADISAALASAIAADNKFGHVATTEAEERMRLAEMRGELRAVSQRPQPDETLGGARGGKPAMMMARPQRPSAEELPASSEAAAAAAAAERAPTVGATEGQRRSQVAAASAKLDQLRKQLEAEVRERCALVAQSQQSVGAADMLDELVGSHPVLLPSMLGQTYVLREHARFSQGAVGSREKAIEQLMLEAELASLELQLNSPQRPPDENTRKKRVDQVRLEPQPKACSATPPHPPLPPSSCALSPLSSLSTIDASPPDGGSCTARCTSSSARSATP